MSFPQMLKQLKQNPMQFLMQKGFNVPQEISNDPNQIIQYLMNNGKVSQEKYNQVMQRVQSLQNMRR